MSDVRRDRTAPEKPEPREKIIVAGGVSIEKFGIGGEKGGKGGKGEGTNRGLKAMVHQRMLDRGNRR